MLRAPVVFGVITATSFHQAQKKAIKITSPGLVGAVQMESYPPKLVNLITLSILTISKDATTRLNYILLDITHYYYQIINNEKSNFHYSL
jgi:hypothetical protein